ncbi:MAG: hypothetical protein HW378_4714 [Anaerolineales bacterium]|nr:hypothetical protein [Anaerolineales bacterium]MBM2850225.1 hypothetical protein [Anaerolineales bacterium]
MSERQVSEVKTSQREPNREQRIFTFKATYMIWLLVVMLEGLIALRIGLKLIGANADNPFAALIYGFTNLFLFPFVGLIGTPTAGGMVLEISSVIAMVVYALAGWAFERLVWVIFYRPREAAVAVTQRTSSEQHTE